MCPTRIRPRFPVTLHDPVLGSYSSAVGKPLSRPFGGPPAKSTLPSGSSVAVCSERSLSRTLSRSRSRCSGRTALPQMGCRTAAHHEHLAVGAASRCDLCRRRPCPRLPSRSRCPGRTARRWQRVLEPAAPWRRRPPAPCHPAAGSRCGRRVHRACSRSRSRFRCPGRTARRRSLSLRSGRSCRRQRAPCRRAAAWPSEAPGLGHRTGGGPPGRPRWNGGRARAGRHRGARCGRRRRESAVDGAAESPGADGAAEAAGPGSGRARIDPKRPAPIATTSAPPTSHRRVFCVICVFLHGASQASPGRRRRVVLSWARAAQSTRSASSAGPDSRYAWIWRSKSSSGCHAGRSALVARSSASMAARRARVA